MELLPPRWDDFATKTDLATVISLAKQELLTALHTELRSAITSQTRAFIWANVGLLLGITTVFLAIAELYR